MDLSPWATQTRKRPSLLKDQQAMARLKQKVAFQVGRTRERRNQEKTHDRCLRPRKKCGVAQLAVRGRFPLTRHLRWARLCSRWRDKATCGVWQALTFAEGEPETKYVSSEKKIISQWELSQWFKQNVLHFDGMVQQPPKFSLGLRENGYAGWRCLGVGGAYSSPKGSTRAKLLCWKWTWHFLGPYTFCSILP